jgi:hypothetical protein
MKKLNLLFFLFFILSCNQPQDEVKSTAYKLTNDSESLEMGKELSAISFTKMSTVLKSKMKSGGVHQAITFCNKNAFPLVDSISTANGAAIKRVSFKYRSPINQPDSLETVVLNNYHNAIVNNKKLTPLVYSNDYENRYFSPIKIKSLCITCHGTPGETMEETDYEFIQKKYPDDLAINYKLDDLRGIWSITFSK